MGRSRRSYEFIMKFWKFGHITDNWPLLGSKSSEKTTSGHILPINEEIQKGENSVLPMQVLRPLIERASGVAILNECVCRRGQKCVAFPRSFGCLLLGSTIHDIDPSLARIVSTDEAIAHAERAIGMGLVPLVIHDAVDAWIWGVDFHRMMNICFCCDCCCDVRIGIRNQVEGFFENIHRLPGLTVKVEGECISCGTCIEICMAKNMELRENGAYVGGDCKGCGRCIEMCPQQAITMTFDTGTDAVQLILERYEKRTNVGPLSGTF
jgi:UDP-glucose 4-epimerase